MSKDESKFTAVYYIKLVSGEEIFCRFPNGRGAKVPTMSNPMILDTYGDHEGGRYLVMTRFCPYLADPERVRLDEKDAIIVEKASDGLVAYYDAAVKYAVKKDEHLAEAVAAAVKSLDADPVGDVASKSSTETDKFKENLALSALAQFSKSKH